MTDIHPLHSVVTVCIVVYCFVQFTIEVFYLRNIQEYLDSCSEDKGMQFYFNGSHIVIIDPELELERDRAIEVANMSPYEFGYYSYWEGLEHEEIRADQLNGYLDAKFEVECGNTNF